MKLLSLALLGMSMIISGCMKSDAPASDTKVSQVAEQPPVPTGTVTEGKVVADEYVKLSKLWNQQLSEGRTLEVKAAQTQYFSLYKQGIEFTDRIRQPNGNWVIFECDHVADRIIDSGLVTEVEKACSPLHKIAINFWTKTAPQSFEDTEGRVWELRKSKP